MASGEKRAKAKSAKVKAGKSKDAATAQQEKFEFPNNWGGKRKGAGRKRKAERPQVPHREREKFTRRVPVLITLRIMKGLPSLRKKQLRRVLEEAIAAGQGRFDTRIIHYSFQSNHLHAIVEAPDSESLARAMSGLQVRMARALNKNWNRKGSVFDDRYHSKVLWTPRQVRNAIAYVLRNAAHHGVALDGIDPYSSGAWFDGWKEAAGRARSRVRELARHVTRAQTWLLNVGWRRWGLIGLDEVPGRAS